jgi:hypothetical protein
MLFLYKINQECLDAFRLRERHGGFPFTSGLAQVQGKNDSQQVTKAHSDSPQVQKKALAIPLSRYIFTLDLSKVLTIIHKKAPKVF